MGIPPPSDQKHGFAEPGIRWAMESPAFGLISRLLQPAQGHPLGVMSLQESDSLAQIATIHQRAMDVVPAAWIVAALGLQGCKLQAPAEAEVPPMSAAFATPMLPFIQPAHGWGQAIRSWAIRWGEQLGQPLVRQSVKANAAVAFGPFAEPSQGGCGVSGFLAIALKGSFRAALSAHVLDDDCKSLVGPPKRVGEGHSRSNRPPVGLSHQQGGPWTSALWSPNA